ncbi:MAG: hypothetical protein N2V76_09550 [Methanophagales archaeon]|nr:hypothetical protein [Methanophagales archaeon]
MRIEENKEAIEKILQKYPYIEKYYGRFVTFFLEKDHPLINLIIRKRSYLDLLNGWLEKLDSIPNVTHLVKKSKNPAEFFNIMSELKVASFLIDKVDKLKIIVPKNSSHDFEIEILGKTITIEVKRIEDKMETLKGNVEYDPTSPGLPYKIDDISTIHSKIKESIIEKKQYCQNIPHVIIFDYTPGVGESEFKGVLYPEKDTLQQIRSKSGKLMGYGHPPYDGLFYKKNGEGNFVYSCLSGVAAIFEGDSISINTLIIKSPRMVFFKNPNAELEIEEGILSSLGMEIYKRKEI